MSLFLSGLYLTHNLYCTVILLSHFLEALLLNVRSLHCNFEQFGESHTFRRNVSHPFSGSISKQNKKPAERGV
jgi:hypothetical protein